jgi:HSP20 family protein
MIIKITPKKSIGIQIDHRVLKLIKSKQKFKKEKKNMKLIKRNNPMFPAYTYFFDDFTGRDLADWFGWNYTGVTASVPAVNISETNESFEVEVAAPGMSKKDFKVELDKNVLTIATEKKESSEDKDKKNGYFKKEFSYRSFHRSFELPENSVESDKINATYQDGVLRIHLPKREEVKPRPARLIEIS